VQLVVTIFSYQQECKDGFQRMGFKPIHTSVRSGLMFGRVSKDGFDVRTGLMYGRVSKDGFQTRLYNDGLVKMESSISLLNS
jgi:hypothetical protein